MQKPKIDPELLEILKDEVNVKEVIFYPNLRDELEFDIYITPELHAEGIARDLARSIQESRQDGKLKPGEEVFRSIETQDDTLRNILSSQELFISNATGTTVVFRIKPENILVEKSVKIDGKDVVIRIQKP